MTATNTGVHPTGCKTVVLAVASHSRHGRGEYSHGTLLSFCLIFFFIHLQITDFDEAPNSQGHLPGRSPTNDASAHTN